MPGVDGSTQSSRFRDLTLAGGSGSTVLLVKLTIRSLPSRERAAGRLLRDEHGNGGLVWAQACALPVEGI